MDDYVEEGKGQSKASLEEKPGGSVKFAANSNKSSDRPFEEASKDFLQRRDPLISGFIAPEYGGTDQNEFNEEVGDYDNLRVHGVSSTILRMRLTAALRMTTEWPMGP